MKYVKNKSWNKFDEWLGKKARILAESLAKVAIDSVRDSIREKRAIATGALLDSWTYSIIRKGVYKFTVQIKSGVKYWKAVDEGTKESPAFTNLQVIEKWIRVKASRGFPVPDKESDIKRLAYAIAVTHSKKGIEGKQYLELSEKKFNSRKNIVIHNWTKKYMVPA